MGEDGDCVSPCDSASICLPPSGVELMSWGGHVRWAWRAQSRVAQSCVAQSRVAQGCEGWVGAALMLGVRMFLAWRLSAASRTPALVLPV